MKINLTKDNFIRENIHVSLIITDEICTVLFNNCEGPKKYLLEKSNGDVIWADDKEINAEYSIYSNDRKRLSDELLKFLKTGDMLVIKDWDSEFMIVRYLGISKEYLLIAESMWGDERLLYIDRITTVRYAVGNEIESFKICYDSRNK